MLQISSIDQTISMIGRNGSSGKGEHKRLVVIVPSFHKGQYNE